MKVDVSLIHESGTEISLGIADLDTATVLQAIEYSDLENYLRVKAWTEVFSFNDGKFQIVCSDLDTHLFEDVDITHLVA